MLAQAVRPARANSPPSGIGDKSEETVIVKGPGTGGTTSPKAALDRSAGGRRLTVRKRIAVAGHDPSTIACCEKCMKSLQPDCPVCGQHAAIKIFFNLKFARFPAQGR
jgi:hypothetical protein